MEHERTLNREAVSSRLYPETRTVAQSEEDRHPWRAQHHQTYEVPLLRIWDPHSGSQPSEDHGMNSREPEMRLDTYEERRSSLAKHLDYKDWTPGPYISCTTNPTEIQGHVAKRGDRGSRTLTVIDPNTRIGNGLPILDVAVEMKEYKIPDPQGQKGRYHIDEYVCPWQVTEPEIVGHWDWDELEQRENWYQDIIMPAFREFTKRHTVNPTEGTIDDLLPGLNELSVGHDDSDSSGGASVEEIQFYYHDGEEDAGSASGYQCCCSDDEEDAHSVDGNCPCAEVDEYLKTCDDLE